ncbi:MAG: branched-chain amino acid transport system ATP-binding protein [Candidatus Eremiobacteraeota bacterium]|jgi:branched-chain amino acid transport system ATP-binding protein|nr:branched-chain amino acid transport system ATP-binding protein [Candidatus Eremiobacteraeota bacterium]
MLEVNAVAVAYGDVQVLWDVSLRVDRGEIVTLLGANGAGKTTLLRAISRTVPVRAGTIVLDGERLDRAPSSRIVELGIAHVPEGRRLWPDMSVEDNLLLGSYPRRARAEVRTSLDYVFALFPRVAERRRQIAGTLSGGEQQMVAIGRGLMSRPSILMLDEPSLGLAPIIVAEMFAAVSRINAEGTTVLLVEQNVRQALEIATRGYVVETGRVVGSGTRAELLASDEIKKAYLGL